MPPGAAIRPGPSCGCIARLTRMTSCGAHIDTGGFGESMAGSGDQGPMNESARGRERDEHAEGVPIAIKGAGTSALSADPSRRHCGMLAGSEGDSQLVSGSPRSGSSSLSKSQSGSFKTHTIHATPASSHEVRLRERLGGRLVVTAIMLSAFFVGRLMAQLSCRELRRRHSLALCLRSGRC